jgi:hypothetical protein
MQTYGLSAETPRRPGRGMARGAGPIESSVLEDGRRRSKAVLGQRVSAETVGATATNPELILRESPLASS